MESLLRRGPSVSIAVTPPKKIPHVHGRGTADDLKPAATSSSSGLLFSSHECVGDMSTVKPRAHRACILRDTCLNTATGDFSYHRNPEIAQPPVLFDRRYGHIFAFGHVAPKGGREDLLPLNKCDECSWTHSLLLFLTRTNAVSPPALSFAF